MQIIPLSQRSLLWGGIKLLPSNLKMSRYGCTTVAICMLSQYYNDFVAPNQAVDQNIKYTKDGLVIWNKINFKKFKFVERGFGFNQAKIDRALKDPDQSVIIEVEHAHWVTGIKKNLIGQYVICDPWFGDKVSLFWRYKSVTGYAIFTRT